jgi:H-type small acid-soluble spore protein
MQSKRAQEIIASEQLIDVYYKDDPVWLNSVDATHDIVNVKILGATEMKHMDVPASQLQEAGRAQ